MSERVHMTAPDGRTFTFKEWCEYLKQPGHDVDSEYVGADGKVFEVGGFRFNVHGHCLNAHKIMELPGSNRFIILDAEYRTIADIHWNGFKNE